MTSPDGWQRTNQIKCLTSDNEKKYIKNIEAKLSQSVYDDLCSRYMGCQSDVKDYLSSIHNDLIYQNDSQTLMGSYLALKETQEKVKQKISGKQPKRKGSDADIDAEKNGKGSKFQSKAETDNKSKNEDCFERSIEEVAEVIAHRDGTSVNDVMHINNFEQKHQVKDNFSNLKKDKNNYDKDDDDDDRDNYDDGNNKNQIVSTSKVDENSLMISLEENEAKHVSDSLAGARQEAKTSHIHLNLTKPKEDDDINDDDDDLHHHHQSALASDEFNEPDNHSRRVVSSFTFYSPKEEGGKPADDRDAYLITTSGWKKESPKISDSFEFSKEAGGKPADDLDARGIATSERKKESSKISNRFTSTSSKSPLHSMESYDVVNLEEFSKHERNDRSTDDPPKVHRQKHCDIAKINEIKRHIGHGEKESKCKDQSEQEFHETTIEVPGKIDLSTLEQFIACENKLQDVKFKFASDDKNLLLISGKSQVDVERTTKWIEDVIEGELHPRCVEIISSDGQDPENVLRLLVIREGCHVLVRKCFSNFNFSGISRMHFDRDTKTLSLFFYRTTSKNKFLNELKANEDNLKSHVIPENMSCTFMAKGAKDCKAFIEFVDFTKYVFLGNNLDFEKQLNKKSCKHRRSFESSIMGSSHGISLKIEFCKGSIKDSLSESTIFFINSGADPLEVLRNKGIFKTPTDNPLKISKNVEMVQVKSKRHYFVSKPTNIDSESPKNLYETALYHASDGAKNLSLALAKLHDVTLEQSVTALCHVIGDYDLHKRFHDRLETIKIVFKEQEHLEMVKSRLTKWNL